MKDGSKINRERKIMSIFLFMDFYLLATFKFSLI